MKILGVGDSGEFIASVTRKEIEKVFDRYYGKLDLKIETGTVIDLGAGHDFRNDIKCACDTMKEAMKHFDTARATLMAFAIMVSNLPPELQPNSAD